MHLAVESHVDRSIDGPSAFIQTNIIRTYTLLKVAKNYWQNLTDAKKRLSDSTISPLMKFMTISMVPMISLLERHRTRKLTLFSEQGKF